MAENLTQPTGADIAAFLAGVEPDTRRGDAIRMDAIFREVTGFQPRLWGPSIVGYGAYDYTYASGHSGQCHATGFAPRKAKMVLYIMPGYADFSDILADLGPHKAGKSCIYLSPLSRINEPALRRLIRAGLDDLARQWPVRPA